MGKRLRNAVGALDPLIACYAILAAPAAYLAAHLRQRLPLTRKVFDWFGVSPIEQHYYEPIVRPGHLYQSLEDVRPLPGIDLDVPGQLQLLQLLRYGEEIRSLPMQPVCGRSINFSDANYGVGDAELLYSMVRHFKPQRIVEIGSGQSTVVAIAATQRNAAEDPSYKCDHVCIEPYEMPWLEKTTVRVIRERVERLDPSIFATLGPNDLLFVDSSHVIRSQGDVVCEYLNILPSLRDGVLVHIHDVRTPRDYPENWVVTIRRLWDEQYLMEALLTDNPRFKVLAAANMLSKDHPEEFGAAFPVWGSLRNREPSAFWIRRQAAP
jgi:hypothetical protein